MSIVMVADDNPVNRKLARLVLAQAGHELVQAVDGPTTLRLARELKPALIVLDIQLPGMDGMAVARALRADAATAGVKILALTSLAMKGDEQRILEAGCDAYLAKPFRYQDLQDLVQRLLA
jgi:two-component system cell cycle response regulator DivK